jgi:hypothetical protein
MTRMCRSQFEQSDVAEAAVVCGIATPVSREASEGPEDIPDRPPSLGRSRLFQTLRRPAWLSFSYSTIRPHYPQRRQPNPFGPKPTSPPFSRLGSMSLDESRTILEGPMRPNSAVAAVDEPASVSNVRNLPSLKNGNGPVVPHPPLVAWDDETNVDLPYDNPYYTRSIRDVLWLPRDPFGLLDLDDTVDVRRSITSQPMASELGSWPGQDGEAAGSPGSISRSTNSLSPENLRSPPSSPRQYTGREEIELPPGIARRVHSLGQEGDVEDAYERRPSLWTRKSEKDKDSLSTASRIPTRRPSILDNANFQSFSSGRPPPRSPSLLSPGEKPQRDRSTSELGTRPDMHAQAEFVRSALSVATVEQLDIPGPSHPRVLTTHEALEIEVQVEEAEALEQRLKEEEEEEQRARGSQLWWIPSWMFRSPLTP